MSDGRSIRTDYQSSGIRQREKTHCPAGHLYDEANTLHKINRHGNVGRSCRACQRERMRRKRENPDYLKLGAEKAARWRKTHPEEYKAGYERSHAEKKRIIDEGRAGGCIKCGESRLPCLDYHHRDGKADKLGDMARMRRYSVAKLRAEIAKCDVLCANCHRWHHHEKRQEIKHAEVAQNA